jgi:hypothetical protein
MKRLIVATAFLAVLSLASAVAQGTSLELGVSGKLSDLAKANNEDSYFTAVPYANLGYSMALGDNKLKLGLLAQGQIINNTNKDPAIATVIHGEPGAELSMGSLGLKASLGAYYFDPDSSIGAAALKNENKGLYYQYAYGDGSFSYEDNLVLAAYLKASYKIALGSSLAITPAVESDIMIVPTFAFADLKPGITVVYGPLAVEAKANIYFLPEAEKKNDNETLATIDPKATCSFDTIGVKGLKVYVGSSIPLLSDSYDNKGLSLTPGLIYKIGSLALDGSYALSNLDSKDGDKNKKFEMGATLKLSYSLAF